MAGRFKLTAIRPDGTERPLTGWFDNLILDSGLELLGTNNVLGACVVGTSNAAVVATQTTLSGFLAANSTIEETNEGAQGSEPYFGWKTVRYRFAAGVATGNISEVGVGNSKVAGANLFSRALILDGDGDPVTISVLANEILDVTYELRYYPPLVDGSTTVTIDGDSYDVTWRASDVTSATAWGQYIGNMASLRPSAANSVVVYNGAMGAITTTPAGSTASGPMVNAAYSASSDQRDGTVTFTLNEANLSGGIRSMRVGTSMGAYQFEFDPPIPKDDTKILGLTARIAWARYVP
jgi:hypothetical protein